MHVPKRNGGKIKFSAYFQQAKCQKGESMDGIRIRVSASNPCPICGSTDYDMIMDYGEEGSVIWCHKMIQPGNVLAGGKEYVCIKVGKQSGIGIFNLYMEKEEYERTQKKKRKKWIEEQKRSNPNFIPSICSFKRNANDILVTNNDKFIKQVVEDVKPLSNKMLDERYKYMLNLLVLEEKHKRLMKEEWKSHVFPDIYSRLMRVYPIRSLPPKDSIRYKQKEFFKNPTRKNITLSMIKRFGSVEGIPGFFKRTGAFWNDKPEIEAWTFSGGEGIIFPVYDKDGYLYRLRYREDYPNFKLKKEDGFPEGILFHQYEKSGERKWLFTPKGTKDIIAANELSVSVPFKNNNCPAIGHPQGKYKTLSSWYDKKEGEKIVNAFYKGCKSGSPYSLYAPENANWKICLLTEGEKKGMVASEIKKCPVVDFAGVGTFQFMFAKNEKGQSLYDKLKEKGVKYFVICFDADKESILSVAGAEHNLGIALKEHGEIPLVGEWTGKFSKGLDDILLMGIDISIKNLKL